MKKYVRFIFVLFCIFGFSTSVKAANPIVVNNPGTEIPTYFSSNLIPLRYNYNGVDRKSYPAIFSLGNGRGVSSNFEIKKIGNRQILIFNNKNGTDSKGNVKHFGNKAVKNYDDVAILKVPSAISYIENGTTVFVDLHIHIKSMKITFFGSCSKTKYYRLSEFSDSTGVFSAKIFRFSNKYKYSSDGETRDGGDKNPEQVSDNEGCNINGMFTYDITLSKSVGSGSLNNAVLVWRIGDLDQPDDLKTLGDSTHFTDKGYIGKYSETIQFVSGFETGKFFVYPDSDLVRNSKTNAGKGIFSGWKTTTADFDDCKSTWVNFCVNSICPKEHPNNAKKRESCISKCPTSALRHHCTDSNKSAVFAIQKGSNATVVWYGSRDLGTTLTGKNFDATASCQKLNGKYYGINGDVVERPVYVNQCSCTPLDNNKFYGRLNPDETTSVVNEATYNEECFQCQEVDGDYHGKDGSLVKKDVFYAQCLYKYKGNTCKATTNNKNVAINAKCDEVIKIEDNGNTKNNDDYYVASSYRVKTTESWDHSSCKYHDGEVSVGNFYQKVGGGEIIDVLTNDKWVEHTVDRCVPVEIRVPIVLTENVDFVMRGLSNTLDGSNKIYAGGGFAWGGSEARNSVTWIPRYYRTGIDDDTGNNWKMLFNVVYGNNVRFNEEIFYSIGETADTIKLYTNNTCSGAQIGENELNNKVKQAANDALKAATGLSSDNGNVPYKLEYTASSHFNNPTDANFKMADVIKKTVPKDENLFGEFINDNVLTVKVGTFVSLKTAYINRLTALVEYPSSDSDTFDDGYDNAGNLYYVPLKYTGTTFEIGMDNVDVSVINQEKNVDSKCSIDVKHIIYENGGNDKLNTAYRYRAIKENDVFNGKRRDSTPDVAGVDKYAQNWAGWYCGNEECNDVTNPNRLRIQNVYEKAGCYNTNNANACDRPTYRVILDNTSIRNIIAFNNKSQRYNVFDSFCTDAAQCENSGKSSFITEANGFTVIATTGYCELGKFYANECIKKEA